LQIEGAGERFLRKAKVVNEKQRRGEIHLAACREGS